MHRLPDRIRAVLAEVPAPEALASVRPELGPCWLYQGTRFSRNGYARMWWEGKERQLHLLTWEMLRGELTPGLVRDHLCRRRPCCSPFHLEEVTVRVNTHRGDAVLF